MILSAMVRQSRVENCRCITEFLMVCKLALFCIRSTYKTNSSSLGCVQGNSFHILIGEFWAFGHFYFIVGC